MHFKSYESLRVFTRDFDVLEIISRQEIHFICLLNSLQFSWINIFWDYLYKLKQTLPVHFLKHFLPLDMTICYKLQYFTNHTMTGIKRMYFMFFSNIPSLLWKKKKKERKYKKENTLNMVSSQIYSFGWDVNTIYKVLLTNWPKKCILSFIQGYH